MTTRRRTSPLLGAATGAGALLASVVVLAPAASASAPAAATTAEKPRIELLCLRVGATSVRTDAMIARLRGDGSTVGSLAWLEARAAEARSAGRARAAQALTARLEIRRLRLEVLLTQAARLDDAAKRCSGAGYPVAQ
jgi:hypothetical protein